MANEDKEKQPLTITDCTKNFEDIAPFYLKETFSDIQLILPDKRIHAHKIILAARCTYFESILMQDPEQSELVLQDVPPKAFEIILGYIYRGSIVIIPDEDLILDVLKLADVYSLKTLKQMINETLIPNIRVNMANICSLLNTANSNNMDELREICHTFIDQHMSEIIGTDFLNALTQNSMVKLLERDSFPALEIDIFAVAANWIKANEDVDDLVAGCIRLSQLTQSEILNIVWPSKIIKNDILLKALADIINESSTTLPREVGQLKDKNLATARYDAKVISGLNADKLLKKQENSGFEDGAYHDMDDKKGITVDLGSQRCFNHIRTSVPKGEGFSFYIEVSTDLKNWQKVIDYTKFYCYFDQDLYFKQQMARYIRVIIVDVLQRILKFEVYLSSKIPEVKNQIVYPSSNVITSKTPIAQWSRSTNKDNTNFCARVYLNQPYMISRMKVLLRFYRSIDIIKTSPDWYTWEPAVTQIDSSNSNWQVFSFTKRIVTFIEIVGQMSVDKTLQDITEFLEDLKCFYSRSEE